MGLVGDSMIINPTLIVGKKTKGPVDVLVFGETPGPEEAKKGLAFVGDQGDIIQQILRAEFPGKKIVLDYVCPEYLGKEKLGTEKLKEYKQYREDRIKECHPKVVLLLGDWAKKAFRFTGQITKISGKVDHVPGDDTSYVLSVSPGFVLSNPGNMGLLERAMRAVKSCLNAGGTTSSGSIVTDLSDIKEWLGKHSSSLLCWDLETSSLDCRTGIILTCAVTDESGSTIGVPLWHRDADHNAQQRMDLLIKHWHKGPRVGHNLIRFDLGWLKRYGAKPTKMYDTMIQAKLLDENAPGGLAFILPSIGVKPYWAGIDETKLSETPLDQVLEYNMADTYWTMKLHQHQRRVLSKTLTDLGDKIFAPTAELLLTMEERGFKIDRNKLEEIVVQATKESKKLAKTRAKVFPGLNVRSHQQLSEAFRPRGIKSPIKTKGKDGKPGNPSWNDTALELLAPQHKEVEVVLNERKALSLCARIQEWLELSGDGYIHSSLGLNTVTWRLSSSNPNLQNIDRKGIQREAMVSRFPGGSILQFDYKQMEYRCWASLAGATDVLDSFLAGADPHQLTADRIIKAGTTVTRDVAKNVNFAMMYYGDKYTLYSKYKIPIKLGGILIDHVIGNQPAYKKYWYSVDRELMENGEVSNALGLIRRFPNYKALGQGEQLRARRQAYNFKVQSLAVMICYKAMLDLEKAMQKNGLSSMIVLQVHDSIVIDCHPDEVEFVKDLSTGIMASVKLPVDIPLAVDCKRGEHF